MACKICRKREQVQVPRPWSTFRHTSRTMRPSRISTQPASRLRQHDGGKGICWPWWLLACSQPYTCVGQATGSSRISVPPHSDLCGEMSMQWSWMMILRDKRRCKCYLGIWGVRRNLGGEGSRWSKKVLSFKGSGAKRASGVAGDLPQEMRPIASPPRLCRVTGL